MQCAGFFVASVEKIAHNPWATCKSFPINTLDIAKVYVEHKDVKQKGLEAFSCAIKAAANVVYTHRGCDEWTVELCIE